MESLLNEEYEELERKGDEELPPPELKTLPEGLRYEYLDKEGKHPVIINDNLSLEQNQKLVTTLIDKREAFGYALSDIKGTDPSIVTHKIPMVENAKPFVDTQ